MNTIRPTLLTIKCNTKPSSLKSTISW